jgi:hypothetical protein
MAKEKKTEISRREFLKDAGLIAGGAALASTALAAACKPASTSNTTSVSTTGSSGPVKMSIYDINGAQEIMYLYAARLGDLNGKKVAGLAADATKWQTHRTFPYIFNLIKQAYPQVTIVSQAMFTQGTGINDENVVKAVKDVGADAVVIGNAG